MELEYLYLLFEECEKEIKELGGTEEERYYALSKALLDLRAEEEKYKIRLEAYRRISEEVKGRVLVLSSGIGLLPYMIMRRGRATDVKAQLLERGHEEILTKVFERLGMSSPFRELKKGERQDFIIFSEYLSRKKNVERELEKFFKFLEEGGKILVFDWEGSGVFDDAEEWALQNGMRSKLLFREKVRGILGTTHYRLVEYRFIEAKRGRYVKTGIFLLKP